MSDEDEMLVDRDEYLSNGVHIGTKSTNKSMDKYIFHVKKNQLAILDLDQTDERIRKAAKFLSRYEPEEILVVGRKDGARNPARKFSEEIGTKSVIGRFMPGTLTNPQSDSFVEPEVVFVSDPEEDAQAVQEALDTQIPVVAIVDSENSLENIDLAVPANNKAENALGLVYFLIARELKEERGEEMTLEKNDFLPAEPEDEE
ncbi:MAG: 30S ribosomal protein S2 [Candidatus Nanohaloarchaea archaeon]